jgi:hypothetical protein
MHWKLAFCTIEQRSFFAYSSNSNRLAASQIFWRTNSGGAFMAASDLHHGYLRQSQRRSVYEIVYAYSGKSSLPCISGASSLPRRYETLSFTVNDALLVQQLLFVGSLSKPRILEQTPFDSSFSKPIAWADSGMQNVVKYYTLSWLIARQLRSQIWRLPSLCSSGIANLALHLVRG